jgi:deoxycytidylate deaminase
MKLSFNDIFMNLAKDLANRSHCVKNQVGAVLTKDTRIISIGYNGPIHIIATKNGRKQVALAILEIVVL